jgi:hypothetical protein
MLSRSKLQRCAYAVVAVLTLAFAAPSWGACPLVDKTVAGSVVDAGGKPQSGMVVTATWDERSTTDVTTQTRTDSAGRFSLLIQYSTYSGRSFGGSDRCEGTAPTAVIAALPATGRSTRERVDLGAEIGDVRLVVQ